MKKIVPYGEIVITDSDVFDLEVPVRLEDETIIYFKPKKNENGEWTLIGSETSSVHTD